MEGKGGGELSRGLGVGGVGAALLAKSPSFELHHAKGGAPLDPLDHLQPPLGKAGGQLEPPHQDKHRLEPLPSPMGRLGAGGLGGEQPHLPDVARPRVHWSSHSPSVGIAAAPSPSPGTPPPEPRPSQPPPDITARPRVHWSAAAPSPAAASPLLQPLQVPRPAPPHSRDSPLARSPRSPAHRAAMGVGAGAGGTRQDAQQPDVTKRGHHPPHHQHNQDKHH